MAHPFGPTLRFLFFSANFAFLSSPQATAEPVYCGNGLWYPGGVCPSAVPPAAPVPQGPTPEQKEQMRQDALANANEGGIAAYRRGDYALAIRYFERALEYSPYNPTIAHNIERARQMLAAQNAPPPAPVTPAPKTTAAPSAPAGSRAFDQLKAAADSSSSAVAVPASGYSADLGGTGAPLKARTGFDTKAEITSIPFAFTKYLDTRADPVVPPGRETSAIRSLEQLRDEARSQAVKLETQRAALVQDPKKASVQLAQPMTEKTASAASAEQKDPQKIVQQEKAALQKVQHLDFSIKDELGDQ